MGDYMIYVPNEVKKRVSKINVTDLPHS